MLKIVIIAVITLILSSLIKKYNLEISAIVSSVGGILIFLILTDYLSNLLSFFSDVAANFGFDNYYFALIMKVIGIGYIAEFTADLAEDFGNKTISSKIILGGKIILCTIILPVLKDLFTLLHSFFLV